MSPKEEEVKVPMTEEAKMSPEPKAKKVDSPKPELKKFLLLDVMSFYRFFLSPIYRAAREIQTQSPDVRGCS